MRSMRKAPGILPKRAAAQSTPPVLIVVSSLAAVGPSSSGRPRREGDPPSPVSHYGRSKLAGENAARKFADRVPTTIVRPSVVFGDGDPATGELYRPIARWGVHVVPTWREHRLSLIHVDDLVSLLLLAAKSRKAVAGIVAAAVDAGQGLLFRCLRAERNICRVGAHDRRCLRTPPDAGSSCGPRDSLDRCERRDRHFPLLWPAMVFQHGQGA